MRRFTAVFSSKRDKKDQAVPSQSQPPPPATSVRKKSLKRTLVSPTTPALSSTPSTPQLSDPAQSSSGSSSGSASLSLQTPDDENVVAARIPAIKRLGQANFAEWQPHPPPRLRSPPSGNRAKTMEPLSDPDTSSDEYDESLPASLSHYNATTPAVVTPSSSAHAQRWLRFFTHNSLTPPPAASSPFAHQSSTLFFPRSCHCAPPRRQTMESSLHKRLLLKRLEDSTQPLTRAEELSIAHSAPVSYLNSPPGVQRWISRPCFEDRFDEFTPVDGIVTRRRVTGTSFAVAALEYPELLDLMAGFEYDVSPAFIPEDPKASKEADSPITSPSPPLPVPVHARNAPYIADGLPLPHPQGTEVVQPVKRGVRFVEDDKDDVIPIGYVLRTKKRREEKAKFLREEQQRRAFEEERARVEEERRKMDLQRSEWEAERRAWEKEKRAIEEERKQRLYAEEVAAARLRRESQRAGAVPSNGSHSGGIALLPPSSSTTSLRDLERNKARDSSSSNRYPRPVYDSPHIPRREASEPSMPTHAAAATSNSNSPHSSSPASSRPPSIAGQPPIPSGSGRNSSQVHSRPPSVYSSSSEDIRSAGKRNSMASQSYSSHRNIYSQERSLAYPFMWTGAGQVPGPLPPAMPPFVMMDMPLLPPTPPFMLHQYPRQRSPSGQRHKQPSNGSTERLPQQQQGTPPSAHRPLYHSTASAPSTSSSHHRQSVHQRGPSGDSSRRASAPQTWAHDKGKPQGAPSSTNSHGVPMRGRASTTGIVAAPPNPWTALPTQHGKPPTSMPANSQMVSPASRGPSRRQTFNLS
ncbi:hypothetical protein BD779DRAFT_1667567 [Infundibulicybe gibba]|nr:hypothetical protein BD779DRAFT_1667567 [Infundibulicybe gibba]